MQAYFIMYVDLFVCMQGSWAKAIQNRLKNMRRKPRAENAGLEFVPSAKRQKLNNHGGEASIGGEML